MWSKFKSLPLTVRLSIVFLTTIIFLGILALPHIVIPLILIVCGIGSLMRIFVYLVEERK
jgi:hypothetical protein